MDWYVLLAAGAFGGVVRAVFGYADRPDKKERFEPRKFLVTIVRAAIIGVGAVLLLGDLIGTTAQAAFAAGLAGELAIKSALKRAKI